MQDAHRFLGLTLRKVHPRPVRPLLNLAGIIAKAPVGQLNQGLQLPPTLFHHGAGSENNDKEQQCQDLV
jgi:hypothetical protein